LVVVVVKDRVTDASVVVRTITVVWITVAAVGVIVSVVVEPLHGVVIVAGARMSVWVWVPMVVKTVVGLGVLVIPTVTVGVAVTITVDGTALCRVITRWTATLAPDMMILH